MTRVNPGFIKEVKKLGAFDISACYNCGNCTAICPLASEGHEFPRKLIRYSILGLEEKVLSSPEIWLCYYCGECTDSCPRQADPGGLMMALRRFVIQRYSIGKIAKAFYDKTLAAITWIILTIIAALGLYIFREPSPNWEHADIFSFISMDFVHDAGLAVGVIVGIAALVNLAIMYKSISRSYSRTVESGLHVGLWIKNLIKVVIYEAAAQLKYTKCANKNRYIAHMALFWGFVGLFVTTLIVFGIDFYGLQVSKIVPLITGCVFGVALLYGSTYFIAMRISKKEAYSKYTHHSDWVFLVLLFLAGLTGFLLTLFRLSDVPAPSYIMFAIHLIVVFNLLLTAPFTKFAHAVYRPLALWIVNTKDEICEKTKKSSS